MYTDAPLGATRFWLPCLDDCTQLCTWEFEVTTSLDVVVLTSANTDVEIVEVCRNSGMRQFTLLGCLCVLSLHVQACRNVLCRASLGLSDCIILRGDALLCKPESVRMCSPPCTIVVAACVHHPVPLLWPHVRFNHCKIPGSVELPPRICTMGLHHSILPLLQGLHVVGLSLDFSGFNFSGCNLQPTAPWARARAHTHTNGNKETMHNGDALNLRV